METLWWHCRASLVGLVFVGVSGQSNGMMGVARMEWKRGVSVAWRGESATPHATALITMKRETETVSDRAIPITRRHSR